MNQPKITDSQISVIKNLVNFFIDKDGSISFNRIFVTFMIVFSALLYIEKESVVKTIESFNYGRSYEAYIEAERKIQKEDYEAAIRVQTQSVYSIVNSGMVAVFMYKPEDLHHFKEMVHYEGKILENMNENKLKVIGVDKSEKEYKEHILGMPFWGEMEEYKLNKNGSDAIPFKYTCPIFNRKGVYTGVFGIYWNEKPKTFESPKKLQQLFVSCTQGAREIGIHKM